MNTDDTEVDELEHQQLLASMSSEERIKYQLALKKLEERQGRGKITFERNPYKGWLALEKVLEKLTIKKYVVVFDRNGLHNARCENMILLANIQRVALVLAENYSIFQQASGMDFHPLEMALELKNPRSKFWNNVFKIDNHFAKGLLFGFGKKNSFFEDWHLKQRSKTTSLHLSEQAVAYLKNLPSKPSTPRVGIGKGSLSNFTIPIFGAVEDDEMIELYEKEKKGIEKIYRGKDLIEITLERLAS